MALVEVEKVFSFDAAHFLPHVPEGHKCKNMHGHTYSLYVSVQGEVEEATGWVVDFADIKAVVKPLVAQLDHQLLNEIDGLENPTAEHIAIWFWNRIAPALPGLYQITVSESPQNIVRYRGD